MLVCVLFDGVALLVSWFHFARLSSCSPYLRYFWFVSLFVILPRSLILSSLYLWCFWFVSLFVILPRSLILSSLYLWCFWFVSLFVILPRSLILSFPLSVVFLVCLLVRNCSWFCCSLMDLSLEFHSECLQLSSASAAVIVACSPSISSFRVSLQKMGHY